MHHRATLLMRSLDSSHSQLCLLVLVHIHPFATLTPHKLTIFAGNYIILPLSLVFGRRPVFLGSTVILLGATIGSATQNSYQAHLVTRIIQGLATGATESVSNPYILVLT